MAKKASGRSWVTVSLNKWQKEHENQNKLTFIYLNRMGINPFQQKLVYITFNYSVSLSLSRSLSFLLVPAVEYRLYLSFPDIIKTLCRTPLDQ
jgi:hypothetical protein